MDFEPTLMQIIYTGFAAFAVQFLILMRMFQKGQRQTHKDMEKNRKEGSRGVNRLEAKIDENQKAVHAKIDENQKAVYAKIDENQQAVYARMDEERRENQARFQELSAAVARLDGKVGIMTDFLRVWMTGRTLPKAHSAAGRQTD